MGVGGRARDVLDTYNRHWQMAITFFLIYVITHTYIHTHKCMCALLCICDI